MDNSDVSQNRTMKGDEMSLNNAEEKPVVRMDIKRLIEASANNMLSELSHDCQVNEKHGKGESEEVCLAEMKLNSEKQGNPNNPFHTR